MARRQPPDEHPPSARHDPASRHGESYENRALRALERHRDEASESLQDLVEQLARPHGWIAATLSDAEEILGSRRWKVGDLLVHRIGKRLLRRPNLRAPWAPELIAEVSEAFQAWEKAREGKSRDPRTAEEGPSPEGKRALTEAAEAELDRHLAAIELAGADLTLLSSWLDKILGALEDIVRSRRWRVGDRLVRTVNRIGFFGRSRRDPYTMTRIHETQRKFEDWKATEGLERLATFRSGASRRPPLGPPDPRPLLTEWRARIEYGAPVEPAGAISIVVLNRDGGGHLHNLFASFLDTNTYLAVEFVVVDHASTDNSLAVIERFQAELPIRLLRYEVNNTFSFSNNRGAEAANGEYLFFLNNDIIFSRDILAGLVERVETAGVGAVGASLRYPDYYEVSPGGLQHGGIRFRPDSEFCFFRPFNLNRAGDVPASGASPSPAVTGAALFCRSDRFREAGGFNNDYVYGYEDIDFCLELRAESGLASIVAHELELIHDESSTQRTQTTEELRERRLGNIALLADRFGYAVKRGFWSDLARGERFWTDRSLRLGFAVEEKGPLARAGDFFTATELGRACEREYGWSARYHARKDVSRSWYDVADLDVLIVMLDTYDLGRIRSESPGLIKVAWMRNWFDRWAEQPWFGAFDLYLCSSGKAARYIRDEHGKEAHVLRIATDPERFRPGDVDPELASDYCFTGSYWNTERDLERLRPSRIEGDFAIFGSGWDDHRRFRAHRRGFVPYEELQRVYQSTKIVVDDANHATRPWGSVNSRVFDSLASGALVITNGQEGAKEVFGEALPTYSSAKDLEKLVGWFLAEDEARRARVEELRRQVLEKHTYAKRAHEFSDILATFVRERFRIAIKVPCPRDEEKHRWGDYHMAQALGREFEKLGHAVRIDLLPEWNTARGIGDDLVFVFRGLSRYEPKPMHINLLWNITHPDRISDDELELYDHVFVASARHARKLRERLKVPVSELLQCTDPAVFHPESGAGTGRRVLFVGNSRKQLRPIVRDAVDGGLPLSVFGAMWEGLIPELYVEGEHICNDELHRFYTDAEVVLNDHWPSMKENGFVSNRIFDAGACGACIVTDETVGLSELFGDTVATYDGTAEDLRATVDGLLADPERRSRMGAQLREIVTREHTFSDRAREVLRIAQALHHHRCRGLHSGFSESRPGAATRNASLSAGTELAGSESGAK
ncbi:MAG: glycosyltransferase [Acidobacteria bacterium]|nr:glycosyltransferase [Acidobacteriota bacterium]